MSEKEEASESVILAIRRLQDLYREVVPAAAVGERGTLRHFALNLYDR